MSVPDYADERDLARTERYEQPGEHTEEIEDSSMATASDSLDIGCIHPLWECKARKANMGANDPQECDWPFCGCDPHADKVIETLLECGWQGPTTR